MLEEKKLLNDTRWDGNWLESSRKTLNVPNKHEERLKHVSFLQKKKENGLKFGFENFPEISKGVYNF